MTRMTFPAFALLASPALAHQGDHTQMRLTDLLSHIVETDHLVFAAIAVITGVLAYRAGKKAGARGER